LSHVAYDPLINEEGLRNRSLKLAVLQKMLKLPPVFGDADGDMLVLGWGSTKGAIEEAVERLRGEGRKVGALHLQFLQPMPSGLKEIMQRYRRVMTVESNWSDDPHHELINDGNRRYSALATLLRARYLVNVDCWSEVRGRPIKPGSVCEAIRARMQ
jgi:2-oxoglutarate ferredoxin oxidoreductase subunit alpha